MTNTSGRPGFTSAAVRLGLDPGTYQQPGSQDVDTTPARRGVPGWVAWPAGVALLAGIGYGVGTILPEDQAPQAQTPNSETGQAVVPAGIQSSPGLLDGAKATPEQSATSQTTPESESQVKMQADPVGCVDIPVSVDATTPITWYSSLQDGTFFRIPATMDGYPGKVNGSVTVSACWNNVDAMSYDQAQSDQTGTSTYSIPSESVYYTLDETGLQNTVQIYKVGDILKSLRKTYHSRATPIAARRLYHLIRSNADDPHNSNDIHDINDYKLRQRLSAGAILQSLISQGQAGIKAKLMAQAAEKQIAPEQINFMFVGNTPLTSIPFLDGLKHPSSRGEQFRYRSSKSIWNIIVGQVITGGTS